MAASLRLDVYQGNGDRIGVDAFPLPQNYPPGIWSHHHINHPLHMPTSSLLGLPVVHLGRPSGCRQGPSFSATHVIIPMFTTYNQPLQPDLTANFQKRFF